MVCPAAEPRRPSLLVRSEGGFVCANVLSTTPTRGGARSSWILTLVFGAHDQSFHTHATSAVAKENRPFRLVFDARSSWGSFFVCGTHPHGLPIAASRCQLSRVLGPSLLRMLNKVITVAQFSG